MVGSTSEDVEAAIGEGEFGMAEETGWGINEIAKLAHRIRIGYGEAAGQYLTSGIVGPSILEVSVLVAAYKMRIPVTVHLAIGTDIPHMHPSAEGAALGAATHHGFPPVLRAGQEMDAGGVFLNWGSAVLLPEVFLKAVSGGAESGRAVALDHHCEFRFYPALPAGQNVVKRPTAASNGKGGSSVPRICDHRSPRTFDAAACGRAGGGMAGCGKARKTMNPFDEIPAPPQEPEPNSEKQNAPAGITRTNRRLGRRKMLASSTERVLSPCLPHRSYPEDLQISWSWAHFMLFMFFGFISLVMVQGLMALHYAPHQRLSPQELEKYLISQSEVRHREHGYLVRGALLLPVHHVVRIARALFLGMPWLAKDKTASGEMPKNPLTYFLWGCGLSFFVALLSLRNEDTGQHADRRAIQVPADSVAVHGHGGDCCSAGGGNAFSRLSVSAVCAVVWHYTGIFITGVLFGLMHGAQLGWTWSLVALLN